MKQFLDLVANLLASSFLKDMSSRLRRTKPVQSSGYVDSRSARWHAEILALCRRALR